MTTSRRSLLAMAAAAATGGVAAFLSPGRALGAEGTAQCHRGGLRAQLGIIDAAWPPGVRSTRNGGPYLFVTQDLLDRFGFREGERALGIELVACRAAVEVQYEGTDPCTLGLYTHPETPQ